MFIPAFAGTGADGILGTWSHLALGAVTQVTPIPAKPGENEAREAGKALLAVAKVTGFVLDKHCTAFLALWHFEWNQTNS